MPLHGRFVCRIVISLLLGGPWFHQVQAGEPVTASPAMAPQPPALSEKDLFPYKQKGRGTLTGQVFLGSSSGKAITQAGAPVHLIPMTPYTRHWFDHTVRDTACSATGKPVSADSTAAPRSPTGLRARGTASTPSGKAVGPLSPHDQSQPHRSLLVYQDSRWALLHR